MKPDVACVAESKLNSKDDNDDAFDVSGFNLFRNDRIHKNGGGVAMWVSMVMQHQEIVFVTVQKPVHIECLWIYFPLFRAALCCVYIPPSQPAAVCTEIDDYFIRCADEIQMRNVDAEISFIGEINRYETRNIEAQLDLHKRVRFYTRWDATLDQILRSKFLHESSIVFPVANLGKSDHVGLWWKFHEVTKSTDNRLHKVYDFRRSYIDNFINLLDSFDLVIMDLTLNHKAQYLQHALELQYLLYQVKM